MTTLSIGKKFLNANKEIITIMGVIDPSAADYSMGHRFVDERGTGYTENGMFNKNNPTHPFNLIGELPDGYVALPAGNVMAVEQPGFFAHLGNKLSENPFKTMFGLAVAGGTGYATYNYATTGSLTGDVAEAAEATSNFMASWR